MLNRSSTTNLFLLNGNLETIGKAIVSWRQNDPGLLLFIFVHTVVNGNFVPKCSTFLSYKGSIPSVQVQPKSKRDLPNR